MFRSDIEKPSYYHLQRDAQASQCVYYVPYMQLLSVDFSFKAVLLLTVHQVLISGPGMSHHQTTSGMERQSQLGLFKSWCVLPMTSPLAVLVLGVFCFPTSTVELLWYTDRDGWRQRASQTHQAHSTVTVTKQHIILYYHHAPCWEIYLRTVILSAKQRSTRTHRWLILSRHSLVYHCLVTEMCYRNSLLHHRSGQSCRELRRCRMANNLACGSVGSRKLFIPWPVIFLLAFSIPTTFGVPW